ncbi:hypothetical protein SAMN05660841_01417 [Sphingobacterium nematocida]|uniref:SMI1/KNR4 family protein n=1 Tax=Sphingobacterium nematocida TaxID=1513896 RepID=A0A1T5CLH1_9SPHI|nr:hypothetical protein [Sphingobacterium nematocida]SKB60244.1 hypothetical protein SAMN05660841_01417 [Sphingobacterium nematocida]
MEFFIKEDNAIDNEITHQKVSVQNFPKSIDFPFSDRYRKIVTQIKTIELSGDSILYNSVEAINESKQFSNVDYWCFAGTGSGDRWLFDKEGMVFHYDHDYDEDFYAMEITFAQWLQMAFLLRQLDVYIDVNEKLPKTVIKAFTDSLNKIHPQLSENYPYLI